LTDSDDAGALALLAGDFLVDPFSAGSAAIEPVKAVIDPAFIQIKDRSMG
jgi:hypothetical protein